MRNFMSYDRRWLDEPHMGDHVGRSVWALGDILATAWIPAVVEPSRNLLDRLVGRLAGEVSLRTAAYSVLGLSRLDADRMNRPARRLLERLVEQLASAYERNSSDDWKWFEAELRYDNARLAQALISGGGALGREDLFEAGLESLRWLGDECGLEQGTLRLPALHAAILGCRDRASGGKAVWCSHSPSAGLSPRSPRPRPAIEGRALLVGPGR